MKNTETIEAQLRERIKELSCLYDISLVIASDFEQPSDKLAKIAAIVKNAWLHSEAALVIITYDIFNIATGPLPPTTVKLEEKIVLNNKQVLTISVHYPAPSFSKADFLKEEQHLLKKVVLELAGYLNGRHAKEQEQLMQRGLERNDRLSILGEITAGIAHELNTPLANILGFAELLEPKVKEDSVRKDLSKIIKSAIYAREVVKKLMFFTCEMPQNRSLHPLKPIIEEALSLLGPNFIKAHVKTSFSISRDNLELKVDKIQFLQLLFNLIINALYVSPPHSRITIRVFERESAVILEVADEGPGVPENIKYRVFEPFFSTKPAGQGSGLGLSVVHGIVKSHKGSITILDNTPKGAIFSIELPKSN